MAVAIGMDVFGTLVDPSAVTKHLLPLAGKRADAVAETWRQKEVEYAFRRALMRRYADFSVCTEQALVYAAAHHGVPLGMAERERLLEAHRHLPAFPDAEEGLQALRRGGHSVVAFSNGAAESTRRLLDQAGLLAHVDSVLSVEERDTFKPDPTTYALLTERLGRPSSTPWLVSSNPWDVIGAKSAGLRAAWVEREGSKTFDPWEFTADVIVPSLTGLPAALRPFV